MDSPGHIPGHHPHPVIADWAGELLDFWFREVGEAGWWSSDPAVDATCRARFLSLREEKRREPAEHFLGRADEALAAILLFDQMPRNMHRGTAEAFATDPLARDIARGAVARGYDVQIAGAGRQFFYLPFEHSEELADQDASLAFFTALGEPKALDYARAHHAVIARFGRFPHRNAALGRADRPGEREAVEQGARW